MTDQSTEQRVYFGYHWGNRPMPQPTESIAAVSQVIRAMNDLIQGYHDPNDWGTSPEGDTRAGIRHIFEACALQLESALGDVQAMENDSKTLRNIPDDFSIERLDPADKLLVLCRMNGISFDTIRKGAEATKDKGDVELRMQFERVVTPEMSEAARTGFSITEPADPGRKQQSA